MNNSPSQYTILESSPQMKAIAEKKHPRRIDMPFDSLNVGMSFVVQFEDDKKKQFARLHQLCYRRSKQDNKVFRLRTHSDCFEIGRVK